MGLLKFLRSHIRDSQPHPSVVRILLNRIRFAARTFTRLKGDSFSSHIEGNLNMSEQLRRELARVKGREMTPAEVEAQRVSFVYGNAPADDHGTRETVRRSLELA